jgi:SPP1 gp7 family putative phage head morphogenesis protein
VTSLALRQTAARIAHVRRFGTLSRRRRIPLTRPPTLIESDYAARLVAILDRVRHAARFVTAGLNLRHDDHPGAKARRNVARAREQVDAELNPTALEGVAESFGKRVAQHQRGELARQAEAALGTDVVLQDAEVGDLIEGFVHENVSRITTLQGDMLNELEAILTQAAASGARAEAVQEQIEARFGIAERHARLIAHDQIQSLNSRITQARHEELGIASYIWLETFAAKKPRPEHVARHGKAFRYDEPPWDGAPGIAVMCHCLQQPQFDDIYAELDALGV